MGTNIPTADAFFSAPLSISSERQAKILAHCYTYAGQAGTCEAPIHIVNDVGRLGLHTLRDKQIHDLPMRFEISVTSVEGDVAHILEVTPFPDTVSNIRAGLPIYGYGRNNAIPSFFGDPDSVIDQVRAMGVIMAGDNVVPFYTNNLGETKTIQGAGEDEVGALSALLAIGMHKAASKASQ